LFGLFVAVDLLIDFLVAESVIQLVYLLEIAVFLMAYLKCIRCQIR